MPIRDSYHTTTLPWFFKYRIHYAFIAMAFLYEFTLLFQTKQLSCWWYIFVAAGTTFYYLAINSQIFIKLKEQSINRRKLLLILFITVCCIVYWLYKILISNLYFQKRFLDIGQLFSTTLAAIATLVFIFVLVFYKPLLEPINLSFRNYLITKPLSIAYAWTYICFIPYFLMHKTVSKPMPLTFLSGIFIWQFLWILSLSILFDCKDKTADKEQQILTFPILWGINKTIKWIVFPLLFLAIIATIWLTNYLNWWFLSTFIMVLPYLITLFMATRVVKQKAIAPYYYFVDGSMLLKSIVTITIIYNK